ncbi:4426_t:CDS:2 [Dentiscutata erythropus]|uniref:4426_t:CDS:1 n=1 Tax=Dentiscutata erythropus TaxID=1348616 RepID=A0A9N9DPX6_9GLOM|nr:4426_t:CDS:2 [Dentiscutata erythropus]
METERVIAWSTSHGYCEEPINGGLYANEVGKGIEFEDYNNYKNIGCNFCDTHNFNYYWWNMGEENEATLNEILDPEDWEQTQLLNTYIDWEYYDSL